MTSLIHITPILHINYFSVFPIIFPLYNHCFWLKYGKLISFLWHINHHSHFHRISIVGYTIPLLLVMKSPVNPIFFPTICLFLVVKSPWVQGLPGLPMEALRLRRWTTAPCHILTCHQWSGRTGRNKGPSKILNWRFIALYIQWCTFICVYIL